MSYPHHDKNKQNKKTQTKNKQNRKQSKTKQKQSKTKKTKTNKTCHMSRTVDLHACKCDSPRRADHSCVLCGTAAVLPCLSQRRKDTPPSDGNYCDLSEC